MVSVSIWRFSKLLSSGSLLPSCTWLEEFRSLFSNFLKRDKNRRSIQIDPTNLNICNANLESFDPTDQLKVIGFPRDIYLSINYNMSLKYLCDGWVANLDSISSLCDCQSHPVWNGLRKLIKTFVNMKNSKLSFSRMKKHFFRYKLSSNEPSIKIHQVIGWLLILCLSYICTRRRSFL